MSSIYTLVLLQLTGQGEARIILALSCVVVASTLALAISIALMRRMRKIAAQPPTKDSNIAGNESQEKESASGD
jgi:hypothetical protein